MCHVHPSSPSSSICPKSCVLAGLAAASVLLLAGGTARAASSNRPAPAPLNRFPRMVQEYFVGQVRQAEQQADRRTEEDEEERGESDRQPFLQLDLIARDLQVLVLDP